ncbi:hypothetical protein TEA_028255 [Camellia sinensis var. sinensis]|uniref:Cytokinin riboside 5'-monophosphate phosphoribohydrolase n=1 Tax=Camellia sinensis var. sinensis TaxID=542762 RepID=A0A4S4DJE7_CAMSN|nr:hypothetical protein TEA_028255 [Camellia sinensis var. sinensis]
MSWDSIHLVCIVVFLPGNRYLIVPFCKSAVLSYFLLDIFFLGKVIFLCIFFPVSFKSPVGRGSGGLKSLNKQSFERGNMIVGKLGARIDLVYGGGSVGLMGLVSQAVHDGGRHVLGVIPRTLMPREITGETIGEVRAVSDMHQRKAEMAHQADAFIALPGGYGTLEELLEVITWAQLGIHHKPVGLLNVEGYYNSLLSFLDKAVDEGFISPTARRIIVSAPTAKQLVKELEEKKGKLVENLGVVVKMVEDKVVVRLWRRWWWINKGKRITILAEVEKGMGDSGYGLEKKMMGGCEL